MKKSDLTRLGRRGRIALVLACIPLAIGSNRAAAQGSPSTTLEPPPVWRPPSAQSVALPRVTVRTRKGKPSRTTKRTASPPQRRPADAAPADIVQPAATLPDGVVLRGGPPVVQTTAGPVSGYRALTSVSATRTNTPIEQIPQSVAVIPRSVIDDQMPLTQSEAFRNVSGVTGVPTNSFLGFSYKVRGFPADHYTDGLSNYYDGGDYVSLVNVERIEVLKGPAGLFYQAGLGPVGGIINSVSKLPTPIRSAEAGIMVGGLGLWNPWFDVNQPLSRDGTALFRMTGEFERSRDYIDVIEHQRYSLNPTLRFDDHDGTVLTIQGRFTSRAFQDYAGLPGAGTIDRSVFTIRPNLYPDPTDLPKSRTTYNGLTVRIERELNDIWSVNGAARISEFKLHEFGKYPFPTVPLFGSTFSYANFDFPLRTRELASNVNFVAKSTIGPFTNVLLLGADYDVADDRGRFDIGSPALVDLTNPVFPSYSAPDFGLFNAINRYENSGLTAQLQSTAWERLHLLAGVRLGHVGIHGINTVDRSDFVIDTWKPLPRAGAVLDLVPGISVFADYSQGMRGIGFFNAGTTPKPEEAEQTEGGMKLVLPSGFTGTFAFFSITRKNVVNLLPGSPVLASQVGAQRSEGFDMDLTWQPLPGLSILGSYAHINARVIEDQLYPVGNKIERVPADSGRLWANYKVQEGPLRDVSVGAGLYAASRQPSALDNLYFTPGYVTFDGKIAYEKQSWSVALVGKNLADKRTYVPFPTGNGMIAPLDPRTVYAVARVKY